MTPEELMNANGTKGLRGSARGIENSGTPRNIEPEFRHRVLNRLVAAPVLAYYEHDLVAALAEQLDRGAEAACVARVPERDEDPHQPCPRSVQ